MLTCLNTNEVQIKVKRESQTHWIKNNNKTEFLLVTLTKSDLKISIIVTSSIQLVSMYRNEASHLYSVTH